MKAKILLIGFLLMAGLLVQSALAKEAPQKVTISGAGLLSEVVLTGDQDRLNTLAMMTLEDYYTRSANAPAGISGDGYLITRYLQESPTRLIAFDTVRYYPDPAGGRGYIYFLGIANGSSDYDHHWFRANPAGEATLQALIAEGQAESSAAKTLVMNLFLKSFAAFFQ
ncbi:MAG: hypothetical protein ABI700_15500 [Chloroflexota bacterium]